MFSLWSAQEKGCKSPWVTSALALRSCLFMQDRVQPISRQNQGNLGALTPPWAAGTHQQEAESAPARQVQTALELLSEDNVLPCTEGHIHPMVSTTARLALPRSPPSCPLPVPGLGLAQGADLCRRNQCFPDTSLPRGLLCAQDPLCSIRHFWTLCKTHINCNKRWKIPTRGGKPSKQNSARPVPHGTTVQPHARLAEANLPVPAAGWQQAGLCCCPVCGGKDA